MVNQRTPLPLSESDVETEKILRVTSQALEKHEMRDDSKFSMQLLKFLLVCYGIASPWFIWTTVSVFQIESKLALLSQKQEVILEIKSDINTMKNDVQVIKIDVATIKKDKP